MGFRQRGLVHARHVVAIEIALLDAPGLRVISP